MATRMKSLPRVQAELVRPGDPDATLVARLPRPARIRLETAANRMAAYGHAVAFANQQVGRVYADAYAEAGSTMHELEKSEAWVRREGEEALADYATAKVNARTRMHHNAEAAAAAISQQLLWDLEEIAILPDSAWYEPTFTDRLNAFLEGTFIELERRGLPRLTPGELLKEFFIGGVVDAQISAYDQLQLTARQERFDISRQLGDARAHLAALADRNAQLEAISDRDSAVENFEHMDVEPTADERAEQKESVRAFIQQMQEQGAKAEPVARRKPRMARSDVEVIDV